jgi:phage shock protein A
MAEQKQDLLSRLADLSEEAIQKLAEAPGADKVMQAFRGLTDKVDELARRMKGFEELERRITDLEKQVSELTKGSSASDGSEGEQG